MSDDMTPLRPYLLRSLYEWIEANGMTPYILVDANAKSLNAPLEYAKNNQIVFNIATRATNGLHLGDQWVEFNARFNGVSRHVEIPVSAVQAIYANENGRGIVFSQEADESSSENQQTDADVADLSGKNKQPTLKIVK